MTVEREHGTRARYIFGARGQDRAAGCRCELCAEANRAYARHQAKRKRLEALGRTSGPWASPFTDAAPVRARIVELGAAGVGYKRVAELAGVSKSSLLKIRTGERDRCRRELAAAVLSLEDPTPADGQVVDAAPTWRYVRSILRRPGWSKARISAEIGQGGRALQLGSKTVTVRNARAVEVLAARLGIETAVDAHERRFPLAPLLDGRSILELGRLTGVAPRQIHRWKTSGVPERRADAAAAALHRHPVELWPDWYDVEDVAS